MSDENLGFAIFALIALLVFGIAYWMDSQPGVPSGSVGAPPVAPQSIAPPATQASQSASTAPQSQATATSANAESSMPSPGTPPATVTTLPAEDQMSEADRRQIQQMLQAMKYYQGPIDGKFGRLSRAAIRRYQDSIGAKSTGYLTAEEATRLASTR